MLGIFSQKVTDRGVAKECFKAFEVNKRCEKAGEDLGSDWEPGWVAMEADIDSQGHVLCK